MNVSLCGMMGCGKSTLAKLVSSALNCPCIDTDSLICGRYGKISDIFTARGEAYFRALERETIKEVCKNYAGAIIALGGGSVIDSINVENLKKKGVIIYLRASVETIYDRLQGAETRPLLLGGGIERIREILSLRESVYSSVSDMFIDTDGDLPQESANKIIEKVIKIL